MLRSLRSRLILASLLWTAGLLMLMHMISMMLIHIFRMRGTHAAIVLLAAAALIAGGLVGLRGALMPFRRLRQRLTAVRRGEDRRIDGAYPSEVQPLIDDLNALLEDREKAVKRATAAAGDLAHGLKTPLAVLAQEADQAEKAGNAELAGRIGRQVERMSRQVNYQLARARAVSGAAGAPPCPLAPCADAVVRTLLKLYAGRALEISSAIPGDVCVRVEKEDLEEILGNVLENACKWAARRIAVEASRAGLVIVVTVDDDGGGLAESLRGVVFERGVRADQAAPGSGLGLAIVRDLAELYGGSIGLDDSPLGGLRVRLCLPPAP